MCTEYAPLRVDFDMDNGTSVKNVVAVGPSGRPDDLYMTYVFAWKRPDLDEGTAAYREAEKFYDEVGGAVTTKSRGTPCADHGPRLVDCKASRGFDY